MYQHHILFEITEDHVTNGDRCSLSSCPAALALRDFFKVGLSYVTARWCAPLKRGQVGWVEEMDFKNSDALCSEICEFDSDAGFKPGIYLASRTVE